MWIYAFIKMGIVQKEMEETSLSALGPLTVFSGNNGTKTILSVSSLH
jgi:hypothetical protein